MDITTIKDYRRAVHLGPYVWPGGYPLFFITADSACLCWQCGAKKERRQVLESIKAKPNPHAMHTDGWRVVATDVNWEDGELYCDNCNDRIESAYAEPEESK